MSRFNNLVFLVLILFFAPMPSLAQEESPTAKPDVLAVEMLTGKVRVVDPYGNPLAGAVVSPSGFRTKIERASHYGWPRNAGDMPKVQTDENGIAEVQYPKYIREKVEIGTVTWMVEHPDFVYFREDRGIDDDPAEIEMASGYRVAITAIDGVQSAE